MRTLGIVKWFNQKKGYGFISCESYANVFMHWTNLAGDGIKSIANDQCVYFDLVFNNGQPCAHNINKTGELLTPTDEEYDE